MNASSFSTLPRFAAAGVFVGAMALSSLSQAAAVDLLFEFRLDGMSTGTCAGIACPTPLGTVTVTGDTTGSLDFSVALAPDVNFSAGDSFWFDLSAGGNAITFALEAPTSGWVTPFSTEVLRRLREPTSLGRMLTWCGVRRQGISAALN
jgi:hypothetical protein